MIYLATPIKHTDPVVEAWRCEVATRAAATLHDAGIPVFSPATHGHGLAKFANTRQGWDYWQRVDLPILRHCCDTLLVLDLDGWIQSQGVQAEIEEAETGPSLIHIVHVKWCTSCADHIGDHTARSLYWCDCYPSIPFAEIASRRVA